HHGENRPQQYSERPGYQLEFVVVETVQPLLIHVSHEVDQAFLLRTAKRIVGCVEVCHQNTFEVFQQLMQEVSFPVRPVHEHDFFQIRKHPHIRLASLQSHLSLVHMQQIPSKDSGQELSVGFLVVTGHQGLEHV